MKIADKKYFEQYQALVSKDLKSLVEQLGFTEQNSDLGYQTQASAVYSSNIEGNTIDLNSFMNLAFSKEKFRFSKEIQEIEDLILAYRLAQETALTEKNFLKCHKLLARQLVIASLRGKYRNDKVGVFDQSGLVYLAIEAEIVAEKMKGFFGEITQLLASSLSTEETFYFAC